MEGFTGNGGTFRDSLHMYWAAERKNQDFFEKSPFFSDRLPENFEYKAWTGHSACGRALTRTFFQKKAKISDRLPKKPE